MRSLLHLICTLCLLCGHLAAASVTPVWSTGVAVPGEKAVLYLIDEAPGEDAFFVKGHLSVPKARAEVKDAALGANPFRPDGGNAEILPIIISPDSPGELKVPDITVTYRSGRTETVSVPALHVASTGDIRWQDTPITFGVLWYTHTENGSKDGYTDQAVSTALKLFLPGDCDCPLAPTLTSPTVRSHNFRQPLVGLPAMMHGNLMPVPQAFAKGQTWRTAEYDGTLTPFREGNADVGGTIVIAQRQGIFGTARADAQLPVLRLGALPLPPGAPADYAHTVGQYTLTAKTQATELAMHEAVEVELTLRGTGAMENLECPKPRDAAAWKLVPPTSKPLLNVNGETVGIVFSQLLRPTEEVRGIPSFSFCYFDPQSMDYKEISTAPIALPWRKSDTAGAGPAPIAAEPPPAGTIPVAEMTDIYGFLTPELYPRPLNLPRGLLYLLYLPAAAVLLHTLFVFLRRRYAAGAADRARERELDALSKEANALNFLKRIAAAIETRIPAADITPELQRIIDRRNDEAFRPAAELKLSEDERRAMLKALRRALSAAARSAALLLLCLLPAAFAAENRAQQAYEAGQYSHALQWLEQTPVPEGEEALALYNKANCQYRLGNTGQAALLYARALHLNPHFAEAEANLAFIQRKEGALLPVWDKEDELFRLLTPGQWRVLAVSSSALLALLLALMLARRGYSTPRLNLLAGVSLLVLLLCGADALYSMGRRVQAPATVAAEAQAIVTTATPLHTAADTQSSTIVNLTVSTPLHLLAKRGEWCYVETYADGTRGWVKSADLGFISPEDSLPSSPLLLRL